MQGYQEYEHITLQGVHLYLLPAAQREGLHLQQHHVSLLPRIVYSLLKGHHQPHLVAAAEVTFAVAVVAGQFCLDQILQYHTGENPDQNPLL